MIDFFRRLIRPRYDTLNLIEINSAKLLANFAYLKSRQPQAEIFPVLKSNAYGHGLKEVCQILNSSDATMVAVDSYPEAQIVYRHFQGQVLILGEMPLKAYDYCRLDRTEFVVYNEDTLRYLSRFGRKARIHLFVNSGMNREGIKDLPAFLASQKKYLDQVEISGLCSHLASAETASALNKQQEINFLESLGHLRAAGFFPRWVHLGNSAGVFTLHNKMLTAFRPGLAFYGYDPFPDVREDTAPLQPALEVFSRLVSIQDIKKGESVSYNEVFRTEQDMAIGVIPFGYFEGLDRRLSDRAELSVRTGQDMFYAQIAGKICMNLSCLKIGENKAKIGDIVQVISSDKKAPNSVLNLSWLADMIPYELLVRLQASIRREIK
jgi:alanine racemase